MTNEPMFASIGARRASRSRWMRRTIVAGLALSAGLIWGVTKCLSEESEQTARERAAERAEHERLRAEAAQQRPRLERWALPGMSIKTSSAAILHPDSSRIWGRLEAGRLVSFFDPNASGILVTWREGTLAKSKLPLPNDPVDVLFTELNSQRSLTRSRPAKLAAPGGYGISIGELGELRGIASYLECDGRIVVVLVWHSDVLTVSDEVVGSFVCGDSTPPG